MTEKSKALLLSGGVILCAAMTVIVIIPMSEDGPAQCLTTAQADDLGLDVAALIGGGDE
jgi:hypothetical protein